MKLNSLLKWFPLFVIAIVGVLSFQRWQQSQAERPDYDNPTAPYQPKPTGNPPRSAPYHVLRVSDGDTIAVRHLDTGKEEKIRFACIDAPEIAHGSQPGQPVGEASKANLKQLIDRAGGDVMVQEVDRDRYGRIVGEVFASARNPQQPEEELFLNAEQVRSGMAYVYRRYASNCEQVEILEDLEKAAKVAKKGVWAGNYQKPWDYRKAQR